jgi:hypothetical protein
LAAGALALCAIAASLVAKIEMTTTPAAIADRAQFILIMKPHPE